MAILFIVFMFGIRPAEIISQWMDNAREDREARREERISRRKEDEEIRASTTKETKRERRLREKEEQKRQAEQLADQITINLNDGSLDDNNVKNIIMIKII